MTRNGADMTIVRRQRQRYSICLPVCAQILLLVLAAGPAWAIDWSFKAFGSMAAIGTDTGNIGFRRDFTQSVGATSDWRGDIDSRLGVQVDADIDQEFHATVQWVARNHAGNFIEQNLEWAFLRWRPRDDLDLRMGRLGFDAFLLSDYRNVSYAFPWMRPPTEFYAPIFAYHFDGADIAKKFNVADGYLTLKGYGGYSATETMDKSGTSLSRLEGALFGVNLVYETGNWRTRLGFARIQPTQDVRINALGLIDNPMTFAVWPGVQSIIDNLTVKNKPLHYSSIGLSYDDGVWPLQAEAAYIDSNIAALPSMATAYLSVGRRVSTVTLYSLFGIAESVNRRVVLPEPLTPNPVLLDLKNSIDQTINGNGVDQLSLSLGGRWDVYNNVALKAQWSHFWLGSNGNFFWLQSDAVATPKEVNLWSFGVDFVY
jgi:hypothetical protein